MFEGSIVSPNWLIICLRMRKSPRELPEFTPFCLFVYLFVFVCLFVCLSVCLFVVVVVVVVAKIVFLSVSYHV